MNYETIGKFIQIKRKEKGLTQKQLADKIGVTDKAVSKWERGQGCPDVSILEILSKELGVSILEVLKGRMIENEVIKVTEANDYIEETIKYSKASMKESISRIISFIIISVSSLLLILNIVSIVDLNKTYYFNTDNTERLILDIEDKTNTILDNQGIYLDNDYAEMCKSLKENLNIIKNLVISSDNLYKVVDIYMLEEQLSQLSYVSITYTVHKHYPDKVFYAMMVNYIMNKTFLPSTLYEPYKYKIAYQYNRLFDLNDTEMMNSKVSSINKTLNVYLTLLEKVMEVGGIDA